MKLHYYHVAFSILLAFITACTYAGRPTQGTSPPPCPVSIPNSGKPPGETADSLYYGNGALWTVLWPDGAVLATPDYVRADGSIGMKFPWWRGPEAAGMLTIQGRRLDGEAPPLTADIPEGYGDMGFQATGIIFPTEGCWEVTGKAGNSSLTFVTMVVKKQ